MKGGVLIEILCVEYMHAYTDTIRLREVILIDPSRGTGTDTGGHHQQNELLGDDEQQTVAIPSKKGSALADNDDVLDDDDTADEMLTVHMRDSIKIVAGMLAAIPVCAVSSGCNN
jgi:hypothetical protein